MPKINELQLAKELIRFPSITKTDAGVIKFLEKKLKKLGFKTKILEFKDKSSYPVKKSLCKTRYRKSKFLLCRSSGCSTTW